jgi:hypothetical protein
MVDTIQITYTGQNKPFYYIRLGALLEYIQNNLMYIIQVDENNTSPLLKFDTEVETNLMFAENLQISVDPNICLINRTLTDASTNEYTFTNQNGQQAEPFESPLFTQQTYRCYGQIMNIYVHMKWVLLELDRLKDASTNKVVLIDFLNSILSSISSALGGINTLEANVDEVTNTVIIRDKNPLPNNDLVIKVLNKFYKDKGINKILSNESAFFDLYGYSTEEYTPTTPVYNNAGHASFIKDFSFTTEITPQLSTMLTVGATANSEVVGENSTAFSRFNTGLVDRFKTKISTPNPTTTDWLSLITNLTPEERQQLKVINDLSEEQTALNKQYGASYDKYIAYIRNLAAPNFIYNAEEADTYKSSVSNFINFAQQIREIKQKKENLGKKILPPFLPGTGFIPFNMSLTMDGMSGMKIYNKFNINTEYLPANYPDIAEFLIKNITHKIENNKWYTTLESIVTVKGEYKDKNGNKLPNSGGGGGSNYVPYPSMKSTNGKWANELRNTLKSLGYLEKGTELDSGGDISENIYKAASQVLTTIKKELPQLQVTITSGNDNFHQRLKKDSRHKRSNAIDFTISPSITSNLDAVVKILQRYAAGNSPNFRFIDEYRNLTENGTGNHFHISWGAGTESQVELNKALALARSNKISPLTIT